MTERFARPFIRQAPIPEAGIDAAVDVMPSSALHRFADWQGADVCLAVTSGGQAMRIAMPALGAHPVYMMTALMA